MITIHSSLAYAVCDLMLLLLLFYKGLLWFTGLTPLFELIITISYIPNVHVRIIGINYLTISFGI